MGDLFIPASVHNHMVEFIYSVQTADTSLTTEMQMASSHKARVETARQIPPPPNSEFCWAYPIKVQPHFQLFVALMMNYFIMIKSLKLSNQQILEHPILLGAEKRLAESTNKLLSQILCKSFRKFPFHVIHVHSIYLAVLILIT